MTRLLPLLLLASCNLPTGPTSRPDPVLDAIEKASPPAAIATALAAVLPSDLDANVRYLYPTTSGCSGATRPHPYMVAGVRGNPDFSLEVQHGPVVGDDFRVVFWTSAMPTPLPPSPDAVWIIVGHDNAWVPRPITPWPGCWQMVNPDAVIPVPVAVGWQGSVKREPDSHARIELRWSPSAGAVGSRVQLQLMVFAPGITPSGFDLSQGVDLTVGTR